MSNKEKLLQIQKLIRVIPDFPIKGIQFQDISTLLQDKQGFQTTIDLLAEAVKDKKIDVIVGLESRGFIIGAALAYKIGTGFVMVRKPGKLPYKTISHTYEKEYGKDTLLMHEDAIKKGQNVLIVDDLLATGGTLLAGCALVEQLGGNIIGCAVIIELTDLGGRKKIKYPTISLLEVADK